MAAIGSSIGIGNIWKFPALTWKHGGPAFVIGYLIVMLVVGIPMLVLEITLGQKTQFGSAAALRSVHPQFAGVGMAASYAGFITCCLYTYLLALCLMYASKAGDQAPWKEQFLKRPLSCMTANKYQSNPAQLYFYMNATALNDINTCNAWSAANAATMPSRSNDEIKIWLAVTWIIIAVFLTMGPRSVGPFTCITTPLKWILLFACLGVYVTLQNNNAGANGAGLYWGSAQWITSEGTPLDVSANLGSLYKDAYNQVFFSLGTCVGVFYAYGSYREPTAKVIMPAFVIAFADLLFSIIAGFIVWAGLSILVVKEDAARFQTSSTGLTFIAFPRLADQTNSMSQFQLFMVFLWISGIDSAISYMQGWITNMTDKDAASRRMYMCTVLGQCGTGFGLCMLFCSNWGFVLFDLVDHYVSDYIIILVGILQCVAVGWVFEYETTAERSEDHREALRSLAFLFWIPVIAVSFYANFAFATAKWVAALVAILCLCCACGASMMRLRKQNLSSDTWYNEIFLCGVNKISMSVSTTATEAADRGCMAKFFEFYFGLSIKYLNPAILTFLLLENLNADLQAPYAEQPQNMTVFATIFVFIMACMMCAPIFLCSDIRESDDWLAKYMTADDVAGGDHVQMMGGPEGSGYESKTVEMSSKVDAV